MKKLLLVFLSAVLFGCDTHTEYTMNNVDHVVDMCSAHGGINRFYMSSFDTQWIYHVRCVDGIDMTKVLKKPS